MLQAKISNVGKKRSESYFMCLFRVWQIFKVSYFWHSYCYIIDGVFINNQGLENPCDFKSRAVFHFVLPKHVLFVPAGGSLDVYRKIPEHVLGRIAVAVSTFFFLSFSFWLCM